MLQPRRIDAPSARVRLQVRADERRGRAGARGDRRVHPVRQPGPLRQGDQSRAAAPSCWSRRCRAISPTLLRGTVETLLPENDGYITDWLNARDAPLAAGAFGFDEYVEHVIAFMEKVGPRAHLMAVLPALRPCSGRRGDHGRGRSSGHADHHDADGRAGGYADQSDQGQRTGDQPFQRLVRGKPDLRGARAFRRRRTTGLSGLHAADGVSADECRSACERPYRHVRRPGRGPDRGEHRPPRPSTTNISPCST